MINVTKTGDGEGANDQAEPMRIRENLKKLVRDFLSTFRLRVKPSIFIGSNIFSKLRLPNFQYSGDDASAALPPPHLEHTLLGEPCQQL